MSHMSHRLTRREKEGESPAQRKFARALGPCPRVTLFLPSACGQKRGPTREQGVSWAGDSDSTGCETTHSIWRDRAERKGLNSTAQDRTGSMRQWGVGWGQISRKKGQRKPGNVARPAKGLPGL